MQSKLITKQHVLKKYLSLAIFLLVSTYAFAQNAVTGIVTDNTGMPLIGVSVIEKVRLTAMLPTLTVNTE